MTRQQTVQLALNEGWNVHCVVREGQDARCDQNSGRSREHQGATTILVDEMYAYVGINIVLPLGLPLA